MIDAERLFESWLFTEFDTITRQQVLADLREQIFTRGQLVALAHEPCEVVYFVARGAVRAYHVSLEGREYVLAYLASGDLINLDAALTDQMTHLTVDVLSNATLYAIPCERFLGWVNNQPGLAQRVSRHLAHEVRRLGGIIEGLALHTVRTRLARFLLARADDKLFHKKWNQGDIAAHIGTVRDVVGRTLRDFGREGLVRQEQGRLVITNRRALEAEAMYFDV